MSDNPSLPSPVDISRQPNLILLILASPLLLQRPNKRQHLASKLLNLLIIMQESREQDIRAQTLEQQNPIRDLLLGTDEFRLEAVVVLHQVLELRVRPHSLAFFGRGSGVLDLLSEAFDRFDVGFALDLGQHAVRFFFRVAANDEAVEGEFDLAFAALLFGAFADVGDLGLEAFEGVAVHAGDFMLVIYNRWGKRYTYK
jgi:hypothetical protein